MSAPPYGSEHDNTTIPLAQAPGLVELARRARAHEQITLTEAGADNVLIMSVGDHQAILDWETARQVCHRPAITRYSGIILRTFTA